MLLQFRQLRIEFLNMIGLRTELEGQASTGVANRVLKHNRLIFSQGRHLRGLNSQFIMNQGTAQAQGQD